MSLLPMLLVERAYSPGDSATVMSVTKAAMLGGTVLGGYSCDRYGLKRTLVASFFFSAVGMAALPFPRAVWLVALFAVITQASQNMFHSSARLMVTGLVPHGGQQEAIGWLRFANNLGQIFSFSFGWLFAAWGLAPLMLFDAVTSLIAAGVGAVWLPKGRDHPLVSQPRHAPSSDDASAPPKGGPHLLWLCTLLTASFSFLYDLYMVGAAAKFRIVFGEDGLRLFSQLMVLNTALCAAFAVVAARWFRNPNVALPLGIALGCAGTLLSFDGSPARETLFAGASLITLGEIVFMAVSSFLIIRLTPHSARQGFLYSLILVVQILGRLLGASLAFPLVVYANHADALVATAFAVSFALWLAARRGLSRVFSTV